MILTDKIDASIRSTFVSRVNYYANLLQIDPNWLMAIMYFESGLKPTAVNQYTNATGLIQFMPSTAQRLGTNVDALRNMSAVEQMDFVYQYFKPYTKKLTSLTDCYLAVFYPAAIGKPDSYVLGGAGSTSAKTIASQNKIFDIDANNEITKGEIITYFTKWCKSRIGYDPTNVKKKNT